MNCGEGTGYRIKCGCSTNDHCARWGCLKKEREMAGWIGVDLDGTLARYDWWVDETHIGEPIPAMVERVKAWLAEGTEVRIMTARAYSGSYEAIKAIEMWCLKHLGKKLRVTSHKDFNMIELWDDRARQVEFNAGRLIGG